MKNELTEIEKAVYGYLANCLTDQNAHNGVLKVLGRELKDDEECEMFRVIYKPFHRYYNLSK